MKITLNENTLKTIISETVKRILKESEHDEYVYQDYSDNYDFPTEEKIEKFDALYGLFDNEEDFDRVYDALPYEQIVADIDSEYIPYEEDCNYGGFYEIKVINIDDEYLAPVREIEKKGILPKKVSADDVIKHFKDVIYQKVEDKY